MVAIQVWWLGWPSQAALGIWFATATLAQGGAALITGSMVRSLILAHGLCAASLTGIGLILASAVVRGVVLMDPLIWANTTLGIGFLAGLAGCCVASVLHSGLRVIRSK
jgi:hypothetical protein